MAASHQLSPIYRAFVSSTFEELKDHRAQVIEALRRARFFVDPMEDWAAAKDEPTDLSLDRMRGCDLCVLLVGFRRGHIPNDQELSITQLEYGAAVAHGVDVLVFMLDEQAAWPRKFDELDRDPQIRRWREQLKKKRTVSFFDNDLHSIKIESALTRWVMDVQSKGMSLDEYRKMKMDFERLERLIRKAPVVENSDAYHAFEIPKSLIREFQSLAPKAER